MICVKSRPILIYKNLIDISNKVGIIDNERMEVITGCMTLYFLFRNTLFFGERVFK